MRILLHEINLKKIIEEKLTKNTRVMNSIGRPIKVTLDQRKDLIMSENTATVNFN